MNSLAYLITVLNPLLLNSRYATVELGPLYSLVNDINKLPNFPPDAFKNNGYHRHGNIGVYVSENLRDFIYNSKGEPDDEGFLLRIDFESTKMDPPNNAGALSFFFYPENYNEADSKKVDQYIRTLQKKPTQ